MGVLRFFLLARDENVDRDWFGGCACSSTCELGGLFLFLFAVLFFETIDDAVEVPLRPEVFCSLRPALYSVIIGRFVVRTTYYVFQLLRSAV